MESNTNTTYARILVVEDEPFQRRILSAVLRSKGFGRICEADSGAAAISLLETEIINTVLSDVEMPGSNGLELLRQIRSGQTPVRRDIGFIVLTSHSNTEVLGAAMALDVNGFIVKPFTTRVLLDKITRTRSETMTLRPESEYLRVVTDLASLRKLRLSEQDDSAENSQPSAAADGLSGRSAIAFADLRVGMRVANNLTAIDGTVILAAETVLTAALINLLSDLKDLIAGAAVSVYDQSLEPEAQP